MTDEGLPEAADQRYVLPGGAFFEIRDELSREPGMTSVI